MLNLKTILFTLHKISSQKNKFVHLLRGSNNFFSQHTNRPRTPRFNQVVLGLGIIPFVPKVAAESKLNTTKDDKIVDVNNTIDEEEPNKIDGTGWERLRTMYELE